MIRYLPPDYADGISIPRQRSVDAFLKSPREISVAVHTDSDRSGLLFYTESIMQASRHV
jgi:hypothetical protein